MSKQTLCYLVLGAGLGAFLLKLSQPPEQGDSEAAADSQVSNVVDLAAWKEAHGRSDIVVNAAR